MYPAALHGACPEPRENVAPLLGEIIPPRIADQAGPRSPAAATQHFSLAAEPRLGIFFVRIHYEAGIWQEVRRGPFPDIADHLPATEHAVARGQRGSWTTASASCVQMRPFRHGRLAAPRKSSLAIETRRG